VADYVLASYGTGAVMAVPAHDERDFAFAKEMKLPVRLVIVEPGTDPGRSLDEAYTGAGAMTASAEFDGMPHVEGGKAVVAKLAERGLGEQTIQYRLRDWLISRQRYWGAPIPVVYCDDCGEVPLPEDQLPLLLPTDVDYKPKGKSPNASSETWMNTDCPKCGGQATRDPDTMDTFVCSSWYFLRYLKPGLEDQPFLREDMDTWLPVDMYVGGADHAYGHLIFSRFITKALHDLGYLGFDEPFKALRHQGMITRDGEKMSKSKGNTVVPADYLQRYGTDTLRLYLMFGFAFAEGGDWTDEGIDGIHRYVKRVWRLVDAAVDGRSPAGDAPDNPVGIPAGEIDKRWADLRLVMHNSIKGCGQDVERFQFNTAISRLMELTNATIAYAGQNKVGLDDENYAQAIRNLVIMLAPFAPHVGAEMWTRLGEGVVFDQQWPEFKKEFLVADMVTYVIQINGKIRERMDAPLNADREETGKQARAYGRMPELLGDKEPRKVIVVPNKLVNFVV
jgi:leucyl-tRNA synthetase